MENKWELLEEVDEKLVGELAESINISLPLANILSQRGINTYEKAKDYFRPQLDQLPSPYLMTDMDKAVTRVLEAVSNQEKILVYGDYDVDGTTSVAMMYSFLHSFHPYIDFYIPDRYQEGYGVSDKGIAYAVENNFSLVITLDCGIKAIDKVSTAAEHGIDFIICDHHTPGEELPKAVAVLDPKREDCTYPFEALSGCGVGFKLMQALAGELETSDDFLFGFLDFVAISTACDIVPIIGENRILTKYGLEILNTKPRPGIKSLLEMVGLVGQVNVSNLVFQIGPRINATGRVSHAHQAVQLLVSNESSEINELAKNLDTKNNIRRDYDAKATQEAMEMITELQKEDRMSTVLYYPDWHKGIIGIVASRCIESHFRPTVVLTESNGLATGSARSIPDFDIYEALNDCSDLLIQYGGHKYAAGLSLDVEKVDEFKEKFEASVQSRMEEHLLIPKITIDAILSLDDVTWKFFNIINQMAPFGPGNMKPMFLSRKVKLYGMARVLKGKHLKFKAKQVNGDTVVDAICFNGAHHFEQLQISSHFAICYTIEVNDFNNQRSLQLNVKDIKFSDTPFVKRKDNSINKETLVG
jgi:single-stranded-DNA-specific exonuclease